MNVFLEEHKNFLILLLRHNVDFILIGGYAVIYYGYERTTADMDIWLRPDNSNKEKLLIALNEHGIDEDGLTTVRNFNFEEAQVFFIGDKPHKIDFLTKVGGVTYEEAASKKASLPLKGRQVPVVHYHHLVTMKMLAGRPQDIADVEVLQKIARFRKEKDT